MIQKLLRSDTTALFLIALVFFILHVATSGQYGFHRDELATLDDARHLEWGFVAYPPLTPFMGRVSLFLFGVSLIGVRFFSVVALSIAVFVSGLMAQELGGKRRAQILSAIAVAIVPIVVLQTNVLQYVSFDYLWGVLLTYFLIRLIRSDNPRWWFAIGTVIGLGLMTKYTMAFFAITMVGGLLLTPLRSHLLGRWFWMGVGISFLIFTPNLIWQWRHAFISLDFLRHIHARDVRRGRADGFLLQQLDVCVNAVLFPLVFRGLWFYFRERKYRLLGWMYALTLILFVIAKARSYYLGPLYPMLIAAGCVAWSGTARLEADAPVRSPEQSSATGDFRPLKGRTLRTITWTMAVVGIITSFALFTPIAPVNSFLWNITAKLHDNFREEIGWPDLVQTVAKVYDSVPVYQRQHTGIIVGNYGEAGAINLLGEKYGLPPVISGTNSFWYRSYPQTQPDTLIAVGLDDDFLREHFQHCDLVAHNINPFGVINEESRDHPDIYLCHNLLQPWPEFWSHFHRFG